MAIVLDDAQWADQGSQRWLARLSGSVAELGILLVVGVRVGPRAIDPASSPRSRPARGAGHHAAAAAARRGRRDAARRAAAPSPSPGSSRPATTRPAATRSTRASWPARSGPRASSRWPATPGRSASCAPTAWPARSWCASAGCPAPAPDVARAVAVLGTGAQLRHIAVLTGATPAAVASALDALAAEEILHEGHPTGYLHPLLRDIVWDSIPRRRRAAAHALAAELLADDGAPETRVAAHLLESDPMGNGWVVQALLEAARREAGSETAVAYLRRALAEPPPLNLRDEVLRELRLAETDARELGQRRRAQRRPRPLSRFAR